MYTQLDIDVDLLAKVKNILNVKDDARAVELAMEKVIQDSKLQKLKSYYGKVDMEIDLDSTRGRSRNGIG